MTWDWSGKWRVRITPIGEAAVDYDSGGGVLSTISMHIVSNGMSSFSASLINTDGIYNDDYEIGDQVEIYLDPQLGSLGMTKRLLGFIKQIRYMVDSNGNNILTLSGLDYLSKFKRIITRELYRGPRTYEDCITNGADGLLALYDPTVTSTGVEITGKSLSANDIFDFRYIPLYDCLEQIRDLIGDWVYYVTPAKDLVFQPRGYNNNGKTLGSGEFGDCTVLYDDDNMGNQLFLFGGKDFTALSKSGWSATKDPTLGGTVSNAFDGNLLSGWEGGLAQTQGHFFKVDLGELQNFGRLYIDNSSFPDDYPRNFSITASKDNASYTILTEVRGNTERDIIVTLNEQDQFRYFMILILADDDAVWSIGEIYLYSYLDMLSKMTAGDSYTAYGQYDMKISDTSIDTKAQMKTRLRKELNIYAEPAVSVNFDLSYFYDCLPNEIITVTIPGTPLSSTELKVHSVTYSEGTFGSFKEMIRLIS